MSTTQQAGRLGQLLWRREPAASVAVALVHEHTATPWQHLNLGAFPSALAESFAYYGRAPQREYLLHHREPVVLEPTLGFALTGRGRVLAESMPYHEQVGLPPLLPEVRRWVIKPPALHVPKLVSLREFGDGNYYHVYNDVLSKLALLEACGLGTDWPLLISPRLAAQPFFQTMRDRPGLRDRCWIVHDQLVATDELLVCKPMPHCRRNFDAVLDWLALPPADPRHQRRVLLVRDPRRGRWLANQADVIALCTARGFAVFDSDTLSFLAQAALFAQTRYIVGIHGAGLTNVIYRRNAPLGMLELFPPDNLPPHYFWLAQSYGFDYTALVGQSSGQQGGFVIDTAQLAAAMDQLLADEPGHPANLGNVYTRRGAGQPWD